MNDKLKEFFINCILQKNKYIKDEDVFNFINLYRLTMSKNDKYNRFKIVKMVNNNNLLENFYDYYKHKIFLSPSQVRRFIEVDKKVLVKLFHSGYFPYAYCESCYNRLTYMFLISILEKYAFEIEDDYKRIISSCMYNKFVLQIQESSLKKLQIKIKSIFNQGILFKKLMFPDNIEVNQKEQILYFSCIPINFKNSNTHL